MAKKRAPRMTPARWLSRARSAWLRNGLKNDAELEDFQAIVRFTGTQENLSWDAAIALRNMVYGWMPTMVRFAEPHSADQRKVLIGCLKKVKAGQILSSNDLESVQQFANNSIVGASKLLHVLCPDK